MLKLSLFFLCLSLITAWPQRGYDQSEHVSSKGLGNVSPQLRYRRQQLTDPQEQRKLRPVRKVQQKPQARAKQSDINSLSGNRQLRPVELSQQNRRVERPNRLRTQQIRRNEGNIRPDNQQLRRREGQPGNQNIERSWDIERNDDEQTVDLSSTVEAEERSSFYEDQKSSSSYNAEERSSSYGSIPPPPEQAKIEAAVAAGAAGYNAESYTDPQRLQFQIHGQGGPNSYRFGYDTGVGYNRQFRYEERDEYGVLHGRYGYYDQEGKLQIVNYTADPEKGFQAEGDHVPKPQY